MRTTAALILAATIGATGIAFAANDATTSIERPQRQVTAIEAIKARMEGLGYDVKHAGKGDEVYRLRLVERQSGGEVKATFDKASGEMVAAEPAQDKDARGHDKTNRDEDAHGYKEREHSRAERHGSSERHEDHDED